MKRFLTSLWSLLPVLALGAARLCGAALELKPEDHVVLVGGALADRMQHSGHFEALVHGAFPNHRLVFRNLAAAGDEVGVRHRSENFGSPDDWLKRTQADVILGFFGANEAARGAAGLDRFRSELKGWIQHVRGQNYSGKGAPRVVLFTPVLQERHRDPNFADPTTMNANLRMYAAAMAEVAKGEGVPVVDLVGPSERAYAAASAAQTSLTVNGYLLTSEGDRALAPALFEGLFGRKPADSNLEKLRSVINAKNFEWHQRYRTIDGYNVYGGRSALAYQPGKGGFVSDRNAPEPYVSNYKVMQEEMAVRDVMTANRDKVVWAAATGREIEVDDSNLPKVTKVVSNKPGKLPDGKHEFLGGEEAIAKMTVHSKMKVNLFATEERFPELVQLVQMAWDTRGRLWVAVWPNYPERAPDSKVGDSLLIFEDTDGDGKADKCTHFIDDLNGPTGFQFYKDGVLLVQAPDLWYVRDTDGDGKADYRERVLMGLDSADSHHTSNAVALDPGGSIYLSDGVFHRTQVETAFGPVRNDDAAIFRFEPRTGRFETYIPYGFANPHGKVFDRWGNDFVTDATGNNTYFGPAISGRLPYPAKHPGIRDFWNRPSRPCPGTGMISSRHFPEEFQGNFLNLNVISFQGIYRVKVDPEGSGLKGETQENLISSSDPNFRPICISTGPDGALYFCDWNNPIIGHMQHHLRDPSRDHQHGRIYRITYEGRPLLKAPKIAGQPVPALLELLKSPEDGVRELAKIELGTRDTAEVLAATRQWIAGLDRKDAEYEHHRMEGLWLHQWHNVVDVALLKQVLASPDPRARAAATRVLCYWRDRVPDALALLKGLAADEHPRVRLEAVRSASYFDEVGAVDVALASLKKPSDYYLDYVLKESLRQLEPTWRKAVAEGKPVAADNPAGVEYLMRSASTAELLKFPRTPGVLGAILRRPDVADLDRGVALAELAQSRKVTRVAALLDALDDPATDPASASALGRMLASESPAEVKTLRARVQAAAEGSGHQGVREGAWAALALADDGFDAVWAAAGADPRKVVDVLNGLPLILDPAFRAKLQSQVVPMVTAVPESLATAAKARGSGIGRYVRIELPRRGTLTLAEVQVMSNGRNIAQGAKARQSTTSNGGDAGKAVDGRTDADFGSGTQTHTAESSDRPWWEVDLGGDQPIDSVAVWNRTEGDLGRRLDGFSLVVLDRDRREVMRKSEIPAPARSGQYAVGGDPVGAIQRAAIRAMVSMNLDPATTFNQLTGLLEKGEQVVSAAQGLRSIPRAGWPAASAGKAARALVAWAAKIPAADRTSGDYVETIQFADDLAGVVPAAESVALRKELKGLRVSAFVIRTVREQMRFDAPRLVVEAGKDFQVTVENGDFMPHNLVVVKPGTRENVVAAALLMKPEDRDRQGRAYVPNSADVWAGTRLLDADQREVLRLKAPTAEGIHEYVCTFPGHGQVMYGQLVVTKDVDAYLAAHPSAPVPQPARAGE